MYTAPDFVKVSTKIKDVFASYCTARMGIVDTNMINECEGSVELVIMSGWDYGCYIGDMD